MVMGGIMENETPQQRYRRKNREKIAAEMRERRKRDPEAARKAEATWRVNNPEKVREKDVRRSKTPKRKAWTAKWHRENRDKLRPGEQRRRDSFPECHRTNNAKRRAARGRATIPLTSEQRNEMLRIYRNCPEGHHVDHIYPLRGETSCGLHVPWNLQYLLASDNIKKSNKLPS